jgi:hypothetical protein
MKMLPADIPCTKLEISRGNSRLFDAVGHKGPSNDEPLRVATCSLLFSGPANYRTQIL